MPIFGVMAFGYGATFTRAFDAAAAQALASFVFYFAIPVMLFRSMATAALPDAIPWGYLLSYYLGAAAVFAAGMIAARPLVDGSFERQAIAGFGSAFGNSVLLGIPLVLTSFGDQGGLPLFLLLAFHSTLLFMAVTVVLEVGRGSRAGLRALPASILGGLATNPILWGLLGGIAFNLAGLQLPGTIERWAGLIGGAAVPCALFSVGASLRAYRLTGALPPAALMVALKLAAHPLIVFLLASFVFDVPPLWAKVAILIAALPVGVNVYLFAVRYDAGQAESASAILLSSLLSVATVALVLGWLGPGKRVPFEPNLDKMLRRYPKAGEGAWSTRPRQRVSLRTSSMRISARSASSGCGASSRRPRWTRPTSCRTKFTGGSAPPAGASSAATRSR